MNAFTKSLLILGFVAAATATVRANSSVEYTYDKYGNRTAVTTKDRDGNILEKTTYTYDNYRRPIEKVEAAQTSSNARRWNWYYDRYFHDSNGGAQGPYDPYAHTSSQWRLQYEPAFDSTGKRHVTARWFDANDRVTEEYTGLVDVSGTLCPSNTCPDIEGHSFSYDENGQKKSYTDPLGRVTDYTYDNRNRLRDTIEPKRADQASRPTTTIDYDFAGNKTDVTFPDTRSQHWASYDAFGQPRQFTDERGNHTDMNYWPWGPMKKLAQVITHRTRDDGGTEDQPTSFYYDGMGRPQATVFPDQSTEWTFYEFGLVERSVTRKGQTKHTSYDARGREVYNHWDNDAAPAVSRSWDDANRVVSLCNIYSKIKYAYDEAGLVSSETNTVAGGGGPAVTNYSHYPNGAVWTLQYPDGMSVSRAYNSRGQLQGEWENSAGSWHYVLAYFYNADGTIREQDQADGIQTFFDYDGRGMVSSVRHYQSWWNVDFASRTYHRDDRDRITSFQKGTSAANPMENGHGNRFRYDEEGQLVEAWYNAADPVNSGAGNNRYDGFNYDQLGNRAGANFLANRGPMTFTRKDNKLNQYHTWGSNPASYDDDIGNGWGALGAANGVLMQDGNVTAGFNALNQPIMINTASMGGDWMFFGYDPLGRCVKRWRGALVTNNPFPGIPAPWSNPATYYYYDGTNLIQEGAQSGSADRVYIHGAGIDRPMLQIKPGNPDIHYFHYDANGNCILQVDSGGAIVEQYEYDAFGYPYFYNANGAAMTVNGQPGSSWGNRFLFTGREWLSDLKLYDYRARMYQPELARFLQPDPSEFAAGDYNLYRYCHNDPVNKSDPTGLQDEITSTPNLTITGQGDWARVGSALTNGDRLSAAKNYVGEIKSIVDKALVKANDNSPFVKWSASIHNVQQRAEYFGKYSPTATTTLGTKSTAVRDGGSVASFKINLQVNINWNESRSASFATALGITDEEGIFHNKTGEIAHTRDIVTALNSSYGRSQSAVSIANMRAGTMVGLDMSAAEASRQMDDALTPWVKAWHDETKKRDLSGEHLY